jgi:uncharacterized transporter YbjL
MSMTNPTLIEPGVKYFFNQTLKQCNTKKISLYNTLCNIGLLITFLVIMFSILYYKKTTKKSSEELNQEEENKQRYILSTVQKYTDNKLRENQQLITNLPPFNPDDIIYTRLR